MFSIKQGRKIVRSGIKTYQAAMQAAYEMALPQIQTKNLTKQQIAAMNFLVIEDKN